MSFEPIEVAEPGPGAGERLLTFEVGGHLYAVPIAEIAEVAEIGALACVPTLPERVGGVMNHHGDALPVLHREVLFEHGEAALPAPQHLLVLARSPEDPGALGVPVDRIHGLVPGSGGTPRGEDPVVERRPIDGRVVAVLDAARLLRRAEQVIRDSIVGPDPAQGGEA